MKYLKFFESSLVDSKINLIETLFLEIYDEGFDYYVLKGSGSSMQISLFDGVHQLVVFITNLVVLYML